MSFDEDCPSSRPESRFGMTAQGSQGEQEGAALWVEQAGAG